MEDIGIAINELHQKAMSFAEEAHYAKKRKDMVSAQASYLSAFPYEKAAAMLLVNEHQQEPTRSVLFRSAANLLLNLPKPTLNHLRQAEQMVAYGLIGSPPKEIAEELREAWRELMTYLKNTAAA